MGEEKNLNYHQHYEKKYWPPCHVFKGPLLLLQLLSHSSRLVLCEMCHNVQWDMCSIFSYRSQHEPIFVHVFLDRSSEYRLLFREWGFSIFTLHISYQPHPSCFRPLERVGNGRLEVRGLDCCCVYAAATFFLFLTMTTPPFFKDLHILIFFLTLLGERPRGL